MISIPLSSSTTSYTLALQSLSTGCGTILGTQPVGQGGSPVPTIGGPVPDPTATQHLSTGFSGSCTEGPPPPAWDGYTFAESFHVRDHLGTLRLETGAGGEVTGRHDFYPFGTEVPGPGGEVAKDGSRKRYTGHERDAGTGLDYMLARYYGGAVGRFVSVDPLSGQGGVPQSWNRVAYVRANPTALVDPNGQWPASRILEDPKLKGYAYRIEMLKNDVAPLLEMVGASGAEDHLTSQQSSARYDVRWFIEGDRDLAGSSVVQESAPASGTEFGQRASVTLTNRLSINEASYQTDLVNVFQAAYSTHLARTSDVQTESIRIETAKVVFENANAFGFSPTAMAAYAAQLRSQNRYPTHVEGVYAVANQALENLIEEYFSRYQAIHRESADGD